jgi:hypothetical protein
MPLCTVGAHPTTPALVPCRPTTATTGELYLPEADLARSAKLVTARTTFQIDHPAFDLDAARKRAKITAATFGYERHDERWILVDDAAPRTLLVGPRGAIEDLPGDWLTQLVALDGFDSTTVFWNAATAADAKRIVAEAQRVHVQAQPFAFKGHTDADRLTVSFTRADVPVVGALLKKLGYRMSASGVTK